MKKESNPYAEMKDIQNPIFITLMYGPVSRDLM